MPSSFRLSLHGLCAAALLAWGCAQAQPQWSDTEDDAPPAHTTRTARVAVPPGVQRLADIPYGPHPRQRMDVYLPATPVAGAPVVLMVHGGAWRTGDKALARVVQHKVARWVPRGVVFVSINYRLHPDADPLQQAQDVAQALAAAQQQAARWGADARRFVLMGHSAGAHLVALVHTSPTLAQQANAQPWLGTVALDSAALDMPAIMAAPHYRFYDAVMGPDPRFWQAVSPRHAVAGAAAPLLLVCSSTRPDDPCRQADALARHAQALGTRAEVLPQRLSHGDINAQLGQEGAYTRSVEAFLASLSPALAQRLLQ